MDEYSKYLIKEYKYWNVTVGKNQSYLGRCTIWCKRENATNLTEATSEEREELFLVLRELRRAVSEVFSPDWFNYSFLGNKVRHLHCHFVPRYARTKIFEGVKFEDKLYGKNWQTDETFVTPAPVLDKIKSVISGALN